RYQRVFDDRLELRVSDYQFGGSPYVFSLASLRDALGRDDHAEMTFPFRTDLQRLAWRALIGESRGHAQFTERDSGRLALGYGREYAEAGGIAWLGPCRRIRPFVVSFTDERSR